MIVDEKLKGIQERIRELRSELDTNSLKFRNLVERAKEERKKRDELNAQVKELSKQIRSLFEEREKHLKRAEELKKKKNEVYEEMAPFSGTVRELKEARNRFNEAARGREESLLRRLQDIMVTLKERDLSPKQELFLFEQALILKYRIIARRAADALHKKILGLREESLLPYIEKLKEIDKELDEEYRTARELLERARELIAKRDSARAEAQEHHQKFVELDREIKEVKIKLDAARLALKKLRGEERELIKKLRGGRKARLELEKNLRLQEARRKYKNGESLSLEELRLLMEAGDV
ncbi:MAG: hypothetical protein J7L88_05630 [Thermoplasmata archaeon]|nr:hypothetical protein [Thermoplasmata archaeon]